MIAYFSSAVFRTDY